MYWLMFISILAILPLLVVLILNLFLKYIIKKKIPVPINFLIFTIIFIAEAFLLNVTYMRRGLRSRITVPDPMLTRYEPVYTSPSRVESEAERIQRIRKLEELKSNGNISQDIFDKATSNTEVK